MDFVRSARAVALRLVAGRGHYQSVVEAVITAERSVWIATANLKELMVEDPRARPGRRRTLGRQGRSRAEFRSVLAVFEDLVAQGVDIRLLHAGVPSRPFREELGRRRGLRPLRVGVPGAGRLVRGGAGSFEMRRCPRVHFKMVVIDGARVYLGSANWTGAGLGAKGEGRRNFELGIVSEDDLLLDESQGFFDQVWRGRPCAACRLRDVCPAPLDVPR
jgi:phosphatidylserine/phosphatidylglycerophosphate/cardiolipin synthase-like enzyme